MSDSPSPAEHAATVRQGINSAIGWGVTHGIHNSSDYDRWRESLDALVALAARADELEDALRRAQMRAIDAYNECGIAAPQDHFLLDIENIACAALGREASSSAKTGEQPTPNYVECKRIRDENSTGPVCSCQDGACALGEQP